MKKFILIFISISILSIFIGTAVFLYQKSQEKPIIFDTNKAFRTTIIKNTVATGSIKPRKEIEIKPQVSGIIDKLYVESGAIVNKGDLLARIQLIPDMEHLSNAESRLELSRINLKTAKLNLDRQSQLFKKNLIGELEHNRFLLDYDLKVEAVNSAENTVALIKEGVSKKSGKVANLVRSTISGMVLAVSVKEGTFVTETNNFNQGTTIANVANMQDLIFEGKLDESEIGKVKKGMDLILRIGALPDTPIKATLEYVSPKGVNDRGTIKFEIKAAVAVQDELFLRAGYSANANIVLDKREDVLALNEGDLIFENDKTYLDIEIAEQEFARKEIKTGLSDGINIEVIAGIDDKTHYKKLVK